MWHSVTTKDNFNSNLPRVPWLMLAEEEDDKTCGKFFSLYNGMIMKKSIPMENDVWNIWNGLSQMEKRVKSVCCIHSPVFKSSCHIRITPNIIDPTRLQSHEHLSANPLLIHLTMSSWSLRDTTSSLVLGDLRICYGIRVMIKDGIMVSCFGNGYPLFISKFKEGQVIITTIDGDKQRVNFARAGQEDRTTLNKRRVARSLEGIKSVHHGLQANIQFQAS
ncbi:hypothetical protein H5410_043885 [Solanum commersonii]|uniref:Uncharacterized protein n=1 Tax=Solanum commersonii TaxID=4109 RepID=A0A9J5XYF2_SOLCO|nr:hypothetical protein H5410_043885 [Solanum commersonii]